MRKNYVKAKTEKTQQNRKCRLCGDRVETMNHIISEFSKKSIKLDTTGWEKYSILADLSNAVVWIVSTRMVQETEIWPYERFMHNPESVLDTPNFSRTLRYKRIT